MSPEQIIQIVAIVILVISVGLIIGTAVRNAIIKKKALADVKEDEPSEDKENAEGEETIAQSSTQDSESEESVDNANTEASTEEAEADSVECEQVAAVEAEQESAKEDSELPAQEQVDSIAEEVVAEPEQVVEDQVELDESEDMESEEVVQESEPITEQVESLAEDIILSEDPFDEVCFECEDVEPTAVETEEQEEVADIAEEVDLGDGEEDIYSFDTKDSEEDANQAVENATEEEMEDSADEEEVEPAPVADTKREYSIREQEDSNKEEKVDFIDAILGTTEKLKGLYNQMKNVFMQFDGITSSITKKADIFKVNGVPIAKMTKREKLEIAFASDNPEQMAEMYGAYVSDEKLYEKTPVVFILKSQATARLCTDIIEGIIAPRNDLNYREHIRTNDYVARLAKKAAKEQD